MLFQGLRLVALWYGLAVVNGEVSLSQPYQQTNIVFAENIVYSPINRTCEVARVQNPSSAFMGIVPILFDILLLVLTALKALRSPVTLKTNSIVRVESRLSP